MTEWQMSQPAKLTYPGSIPGRGSNLGMNMSMHNKIINEIVDRKRSFRDIENIVFSIDGYYTAMSEREALNSFNFGNGGEPTTYLGFPYSINYTQEELVVYEPKIER